MNRLIATPILIFLFLLSCSGSGSNQGTQSENTVYGDFSGSIVVDGIKRTFLYHIPKNTATPPPLIIALHGGGGSGESMINLTKGGFNTLSEEYGFIVVYPDAIEKHWNDGRGIEDYYSNRENIDDVKFISSLINHFYSNFNIDKSRVFVTGMSNGGLMSFRLACELNEKIKAIATVAASMSENIYSTCQISKPISVMIIHGTEDLIIPFEGGAITFNNTYLGEVIGAENTANYFSNINSCTNTTNKQYLADTDPEDGTRVWKIENINCENGTKVMLLGIDGGGHTWPDGSPYFPESIIGRVCKDINGCEEIVKFFLE